MKTHLPKVNLEQRKWHVIDADGAVLGRLAAQVANVLRGKDKPVYTPHLDTGDFVVVKNFAGVKITGRKFEERKYYRYSGHIGGLNETPLPKLMKENPAEVLRRAVYRMLPDNKLRDKMIKRLTVKQ